MEIWVRSQDRKNLIKINALYTDIPSDFGQEGFGIYCDKRDSYVSNTLLKIGQYKTKERTLEVLDEIQKLIKPTFKINYEYDDSQPIIDGEWLKSLKAESKIEELSCYVYEMPKE